MQKLTISGYSTALFSTWIFVDEWALLLDAGDGVTAGLTQKSRKVSTVAVSHADRDHVTGLLQLIQLNAREGGLPRICYPRDSGSFPALADFCRKFDPQVRHQPTWIPVGIEDEIPMKGNLLLKPIANHHVVPPSPELTKSLSFAVVRRTHKLKPKFADLTNAERGTLAAEHGSEFLTEPKEDTLLTYSADTPIEPSSHWLNPEVLIHESTFLNKEDAAGSRHSVLSDVLMMVSQMPQLQILILSHFSTRYDSSEVITAIQQEARHYAISVPIYAFLPGQVHFDLLNSPPIHPATC